MKVYELMAELADMDAGAEVEISVLISNEEFLNGSKFDDDLTSLRFKPCEIDKMTCPNKINISTELVK